MKNYYYLISLFALGLCINGNFYGNFILIFLCVLYYYMFFHNQWWIVFVILVLFNFHFLANKVNKPIAEVVKVVDIKQNYVVGDTGEEKVYLYNTVNVGYGDILEIEGRYEEVYTLQNFALFNFTKFSHRKGIYYQMYVDNYTILSKNRSIKNLLLEYVQAIDNEKLRQYLLQIFYQIKEEQHIELLFLSGFHLRFLSKWIRKICKINEYLLTTGFVKKSV